MPTETLKVRRKGFPIVRPTHFLFPSVFRPFSLEAIDFSTCHARPWDRYVCMYVFVCVYIYMYIIRVHFHIAEPPLRFSRLLKMKTMYVCTRSALKLVIWTFHREQFRFRNSSSHGSPVSYHWNGFQSHGAWKCN